MKLKKRNELITKISLFMTVLSGLCHSMRLQMTHLCVWGFFLSFPMYCKRLNTSSSSFQPHPFPNLLHFEPNFPSLSCFLFLPYILFPSWGQISTYLSLYKFFPDNFPSSYSLAPHRSPNPLRFQPSFLFPSLPPSIPYVFFLLPGHISLSVYFLLYL